jgi:hypothetical protein
MLRAHADLIVVLAAWVVLASRYFLGNFLVAHDAAQVLEMFHYFYNHLVAGGAPPHWFAYGLHSRPAGVPQIGALSAPHYPVALVGWLFGVRNANTLFVVAALLEQLVLLLGLHALGRTLFRSPLTRIYVGIAAASTAYFWTQVSWNQRTYYLWPFVLLYLLRFFATRRLSRLWASLLALVVTFYGIPQYATAVQLLVFLLFLVLLPLAVPAWRRWPDWSSARAPVSLALAGVLGLTAISFLVVTWEGLAYTMPAMPSRVPGSATVTIETYLVYAGPSVAHYLEFLFAVPFEIDLNTTTYVGLVTLGLIFYGVFRVRTPLAFVLWAVSLVLVAMSLANLTIVAPLAYQLFPPLWVYRHLAFVAVLVKFFALLLAGYGLDAYLRDQDAAFRRLRHRVPDLGHVAAAIGVFVLVVEWSFRGAAPYVRPLLNWSAIPFMSFHYVALGIVAALVIGLVVARRRPVAYRARIVLAAGAFELLSYQACLFYSLPVRDSPWLAGAWTTRPPAFQTTRLENRSEHRHAAFARALLDRFGAKFVDLDGFLEIDTCQFDLRRDLVNTGVDRLLRARRGLPLDVPLPGPAVIPDRNDAVLWRALGCGGPTLRLYRDVRIAATVDEAAALVRTRDDIDDTPVLFGGLPPAPRAAPAPPAAPTAVRVVRHSANETVFEIPASDARWLVVKQPYHPYWRATVNGEERGVWEANLAFMAVPLDGGTNTVRLSYDDGATRAATLWVTALFSAATVAPFAAVAAARGTGTPRRGS